MKASQRIIDFIKSKERFRPTAYLCPAGVWTIGWGHTLEVRPGMTCTMAQGEEWLREDIERVEKAIPNVIKVSLNQNQWDAIVSLTFNLKGGPHGLKGHAPKLLAKLNNGDYQGASLEFLDICKGGGKKLAGLVTRRKEEYKIFNGAA
jgi:lysozyme